MSRESDRDRAEKGESENEESMDFMSSQFSDFQEQYSSWENPSDMVQISGDTDAGTEDSEMVHVSEDTDGGTQDSVMVRVSSQASSELVRVPSECLASTDTQESSENSEKFDTDASYSPGTDLSCVHCFLRHASSVYVCPVYVHCFLLCVSSVCCVLCHLFFFCHISCS